MQDVRSEVVFCLLSPAKSHSINEIMALVPARLRRGLVKVSPCPATWDSGQKIPGA